MGAGNPTISRETETQVPAACLPQPRQPHIIKLISQLQKPPRRITDTWIIDTGNRETRYQLVKVHQTIRQPHNTLATWCKELTHWKRPWCQERLKVGGEGDDRGWDGWMASMTQWTWVWVNSKSWWWTGRPDVLQSMGSQRVRHGWSGCTELSVNTQKNKNLCFFAFFYSLKKKTKNRKGPQRWVSTVPAQKKLTNWWEQQINT